MSFKEYFLERFDYATVNLLKQNKKCKADELASSCLYSDENGNHCAFGWLVPEENHRLLSCYEGNPADNVLASEPDILGKRIPDDIYNDVAGFCMDLQSVHDCLGVAHWKNELQLLRSRIVKMLPECHF